MKKSLLWMIGAGVVISLIFIGGCVDQAEQGSEKPVEAIPPTASVDPLPARATNGVTRTPLPTATPEPTEIIPTSTVPVSAFQQMMRSMPTPTFVAAKYPASVEIKYADSLVTFVNNSFGYHTLLEPGVYFEKILNIEGGFGHTNIYHPDPDYILTIFSGLKPIEEKNTPQEVLEGSHNGQRNHAAQYGYFDIEEYEMIELVGEPFAYSRIVVPSVNGYLEFLAVTGYQPHSEPALIVEFSLTAGYFRATMEEIDRQHAEIYQMMVEIVEGYQTITTRGEYQTSYSMYTGICPVDTDPSYGYTPENPIRMVVMSSDEMDQIFMGPYLTNAYFETLIVKGYPVSFVRQGSITMEDTILDSYLVSSPGLNSPVTLYVDQYSQDYYRVPKGFDCTGIMMPEQFEE